MSFLATTRNLEILDLVEDDFVSRIIFHPWSSSLCYSSTLLIPPNAKHAEIRISKIETAGEYGSTGQRPKELPRVSCHPELVSGSRYDCSLFPDSCYLSFSLPLLVAKDYKYSPKILCHCDRPLAEWQSILLFVS